MKKLNLKLGGIKEMLSREQMKKVVGGDGYGYDGGSDPSKCVADGETCPSGFTSARCCNRCMADGKCATVLY